MEGNSATDVDPQRDTQELDRLAQACAYEHWHRMLFARFLAENDLLLDPDHGVAMTLEEIRELAQEQHRDWQELAAELAQRMLLAVFRPEDPVLSITLPPETRLQLEEKLALLPAEVFLADDSLGWVYQFWQRDEKERVNKSEVKIGADELPAVTQLFTEDYMVLFLLENTLGAWWTAKRRSEGKDPALPGYNFTYLRLNEDGSPAAGGFDGWPRTAKGLRVLDPCMGSGHFLVFALPILARMRMEEEGIELKDALVAVLRENLFGLEIDERCAQIAAFNLALAAWRMAGQHFVLPELNLACSGVGPNATKEQWIKLGEEIAARGGMPANTNLFGTEDSLLSEPVKRTMESLHELFSQAPVLGSLIDPSRLRVDLFQTDYKTVAPLLTAVLKAEHATEETREQVIAAAGMVKAAALLAGKYSLVVTNVPYLGRGKQCEDLAEYCAKNHPAARADLATCFLDRCLAFCQRGGSTGLVTPQNWLFLTSYRNFREKLLKEQTWNAVVRLGSNAFRDMNWWAATTALVCITKVEPSKGSIHAGIDTSNDKSQDAKASMLRGETPAPFVLKLQEEQLANPDARITLVESAKHAVVGEIADFGKGCSTGDADRFVVQFWELAQLSENNSLWINAPKSSNPSEGRRRVTTVPIGSQYLSEQNGCWIRGQRVWNRQGIAFFLMNKLIPFVYEGEVFDNIIGVLVPHQKKDLPALWCWVRSGEFLHAIREVDQKSWVTPATLSKVPFDLDLWQARAAKEGISSLPEPDSNDPTIWLFHGRPEESTIPLQVAIVRLLGYSWPGELDEKMHLSKRARALVDRCKELASFAKSDGIVCITSVSGEEPAADRLRALLAAAYGEEWSASKLAELLGDHPSLEDWLRDSFFDEHCQLFQQRPFVWHVWDGRKDGFHALVNYHKLAAPNGEGRKTLEKLIYTTLGDWITRQRADVAAGVEGADGRLAAAEHLKGQLEKILQGEKPHDLFVRWKPLDQQPIGWEPDINDGVRLNIRPWLTATLSPGTKPKKDACILRVTPKIKYGKDRGKEQLREKDDFPWFWTWDEKTDDFIGGAEFDGARWNDPHYSLSAKQKARDRKKQREGA